MKDPFYRREQSNYEFPIASRESILDCLERLGEPVSFKRLAKMLDIENRRDRDALKLRLRAMTHDGQLVSDHRNIYAIPNRLELFTGLVSAHVDGFGFVVCDESRGDIFLPYKQMRAVFHGDRVLTRIRGKDRRGREEGEIIEVLERNTSELVGRVYFENTIPLFKSLHRKIDHEILIEQFEERPIDGQIVVGQILQQPSLNGLATMRIIETLGEYLTPGLGVEIAIRSHDIPSVFSDDALAEADSLPIEVKETEGQDRVDLRQLDFVTIDGEDARDFDDAVYCEKRLRGDYRLVVAVADVSNYVRPNSALDIDAHERGTSIYFPQYVLPMLPEKLSNGLCSLRPDADRLAMVCDMTISKKGEICGYEFYEALIRSKERLTYTEVGKWIEAGSFPRHKDSLGGLLELARLLDGKREDRGALDFETTEIAFTFDDAHRIKTLKPVVRNFAHRLIEECMLCANVCAARLIARSKVPALFRVHEKPETEKIEQLRDFLASLEIDLGAGGSREYQVAIQALRRKKNGHILQVAVLRSLQQAVYQPENRGHFGLAYSHYAHFTSPIRRYPDLLVHRLIKSLIHCEPDLRGVRRLGNLRIIKDYHYGLEQVAQLGKHCSFAERRADEAVYEVLEWIKCDFLSNKVGEDFEGVISAVTKFGFFVALSGVHVEGLVHVSTLLEDYYRFDVKSQCLVGDKRGASFRLGDKVAVQIGRVDVDERKIDLELLSHSPMKRIGLIHRRRNKGGKRSLS